MSNLKLALSDGGYPLPAYSEPGATVVNKALAAGVAESITIPAGSQVMRLWCDQDLFYNYDVTATALSDSTEHFALTGGLDRDVHLSPTPTVVSVYSVAASSVSAVFWK